MKTIERSILLGLILAILLTMTGFTAQCENISERVLRLHIIANSDSKEDQDLKLKVRDAVLKGSADMLLGVHSKKDAARQILKHINDIKYIAQNEVNANGYNYPVKVELKKAYFSTRHYEAVTLPAGSYEAVRVLIGEGAGKNWWCVMFPPMCLPAAQESEELENVLEPSQMDIVGGGERYEIKFKIVEWFEYIKNFLEENLSGIF